MIGKKLIAKIKAIIFRRKLNKAGWDRPIQDNKKTPKKEANND